MQPDYDKLSERLVAWAQTRDDLLAIVVVGSRARRDHPADACSDLDLILFVREPGLYTGDAGWPAALGEVWLGHLGATGRGDPEWQVVFAGGVKVDLVLCQVAPEPGAKKSLAALLAACPYPEVLRRGCAVLYPKSDDAGAWTPPEAANDLLPAEAQFLAAVHGTLVAVTGAVRLLLHEDLWRAKRACDCELKVRLLAMLEWHSHAISGTGKDTWYEGRFMEEWVDPGFLLEIPATFGGYDGSDLRRALLATLDLYARVARATADLLAYPYPDAAGAAITAWVQAALA